MTSCIVCGRELTDPASIAIGIGPECAAKRKQAESDDRTGNLFGGAHAKWTALVDGAILAIEDRGSPIERSVTNDIEHVLQTVAQREEIDLDRYLVIYRDSRGIWGGVETQGGRFRAFVHLGQRTYENARRAILEHARTERH